MSLSPSSFAPNPESVESITQQDSHAPTEKPSTTVSGPEPTLTVQPRGLKQKLITWALALSVIPALAVGVTTVMSHQVVHQQAQSQIQRNSEQALLLASLRQAQTLALVGTGIIAVVAGAIATLLARRAIQPVLAATAATTDLAHQLRRDSSQANVHPDQDEMAVLTANVGFIERQIPQLLLQVAESADPLSIFMDLAHRLRITQSEAEVLQLVVEAARNAIKAERVVLLCFNDQREGTIVEESVAPDWPQLLWSQLPDPRFDPTQLDQYGEGEVQAMDDIYDAELADPHLDLLEQYDIKADVVAPVFKGGELFGLLIAHQCSSSRLWQPLELDLWSQLALQMGLSLDQVDQVPDEEVSPTALPMTVVLQRIWSASQESDLLNTIVDAARQHLSTARAVMIQIDNTDQRGMIIAESIVPGLAPMLGTYVDDATWADQEAIATDQSWQPTVINHIDTSDLQPHISQQWTNLGVQALVSVPILTQGKLFGLLVVHQCSGARAWQSWEIDLLVQLAHQGGLALSQNALSRQNDAFEHQVAEFLQLSGSTITDLTTTAFDQTHLVDMIYEKIQTLTEVNPTLRTEHGLHHLPVQDLHQAVQTGHHTLNQLSESLTAVHNVVLDAALTVQCLEQPVQALEQMQVKVNHGVNQLKLQAMNATLEAARIGEAGQGFAAIGERVHTLTQQLSLDMAQLQPLMSTLKTGTQDAVAQMTVSQQQISSGRRLGSTLKQCLTQLLTYPDQVDALMDRLTQAMADQQQQSTAAGQTVIELANLTSQMSELSGAIAAAHQQLATLAPTVYEG